MLIHIGLYSPLLFYKIIKYCNSSLQTSNMQMYWEGGGGEEGGIRVHS